MALICSNCDSHYLIEDYDNRLHYITGYHCGMCGSTKLEEEKTEDRGQTAPSGLTDIKSNLSQWSEAKRSDLCLLSPVILQEVPMSSHKLCEVKLCKKQRVKDGLCTVHYRAKYGVAPRGPQTSYKKLCSVEGCTKQSLTQGVCYGHLTEKCGGVNPYKYPKKKKPDTEKQIKATGRRGDAEIKSVAPPLWRPGPGDDDGEKQTKAVAPPWPWDGYQSLEEVKREEEQIIHDLAELRSNKIPPYPDLLRHPAYMLIPEGPRALLSQEIYEISDGNGRSCVIAFSYLDGKKVFAECRMIPEYMLGMKGSFDDWMFLGSVALEIKRLAGDI